MHPNAASVPLDDLVDGVPHAVSAGGVGMILLRDGEAVSAFAATCPHVGAPPVGGIVCDGALVRPWHKAMFDARTGAVRETPSLAPLRRFAVAIAIADGVVRVDGSDWRADAAPTAPVAGPLAGETIAVIGNGAAGSAAVSLLRERGVAGRILVIGPETGRAPYDRTALSKKVLAGDQDAPSPLALADGPDVEAVTERMTSLDAAAREIHLADGRCLRYHRALLATGGVPVRPEVPSARGDGVHVLRSAADAERLVRDLDGARAAVIVGDGFIGLVAASGLVARGIDTTVVGRDEVPFAGLFGRPIAARLKRLHTDKGVRFRAGGLAAVEHDGRRRCVVLDDGTRLPADVVLLATGIRPATDGVTGVARHPDGGIVVDRRLRAADGLWAAGDIAHAPGHGGDGGDGGRARIEHWRVASAQGRDAARDMLGEDAPADADVPFFRTAHHGTRVDYLGHATAWDEVVIDGDLEALRFVAYVVRAGSVAAAIARGRDDAAMRLAVAMRRRPSLAAARAHADG